MSLLDLILMCFMRSFVKEKANHPQGQKYLRDACNPSYSGCRDHSSRPARVKSWQDPHLK
jgi:hypothetical protein